MTQYVFMNHRIREVSPSGPVIQVLQDGEAREANEFEVLYRGQPIGRVVFDQRGLKACDTHAVRAWVEFADDVDVRAVAVAAPKKPKRKVRVPHSCWEVSKKS